MTKPRLTHTDAEGAVHMVDVGTKPATRRIAVAEARLRASLEAITSLRDMSAKKGDVLATARIAAIQAAKRTSDLIPLCHSVALTGVAVDIEVADTTVTLTVRTETVGPTGVEMEALTAASVGALTIYDMLKALDRRMVIESVRVLEKQGGSSGEYKA
ncbi:MAG: cyclic pyranopterin monophosphate synthase MoaC [Clostridia bacterium]|nr:cyclic pyranopterin monophosphate synthase MoaC [Deltaproteobacteria bacterium]